MSSRVGWGERLAGRAEPGQQPGPRQAGGEDGRAAGQVAAGEHSADHQRGRPGPAYLQSGVGVGQSQQQQGGPGGPAGLCPVEDQMFRPSSL